MTPLKKFKSPIIVAAAALLVGCTALLACDTQYEGDGLIPPEINANAVVEIEHDTLNFIKGMDVDTVETIIAAGCRLSDDEGHFLNIDSDKYFKTDHIKYTEFDTSTTGIKQVSVSYNNHYSYITYVVDEYAVELLVNGEKWADAEIEAEHNADMELSVAVDLTKYNYATDAQARKTDTDGAYAFKGWYDENETPYTGLNPLPAPSGDSFTSKVTLHAGFMTEREAAAFSFAYDINGRKVFDGYSGDSVDELVIPEGVTYVDIGDLGSAKFSKVSIPSTVYLDLPLSGSVKTDELTEIRVDPNHKTLSSHKGALYSKSGGTLYFVPSGAQRVEFSPEMVSIADFAMCYSGVEKVELDDKVIDIGAYSFAYSKLTELKINDNAMIGAAAFVGSPYGEERTEEYIDGGIYYKINETTFMLMGVKDKKITSFSVRPGTVSIGDQAFMNCTELVEVGLGNKLSSIGSQAFSGCSKLIRTSGESAKFVLPDTVKQMGHSVFRDCVSLKEVSVPDIDYVGGKKEEHTLPADIFYKCTELAKVTLSDGLTGIGDYAFFNCNKLREINIPSGLQKIGNFAFAETTSIGKKADGSVNAFVMPATLFSIGRSAFASSGMETIDLGACSELTEIKERAFSATKLTTFTVPDTIEDLPDYCFYNCQQLKSVDLGKVSSIGERAFYYDQKLTDVTFSEELELIDNYAFYYCAMSEVVLPDAVVTLGNNVFWGCSKLTSVTLGKNCANLGTFPFVEDEIEGYTPEFASASMIFYSCKKLREIKVSPENTNFHSDNGILYANGINGEYYDEKAVLYCIPAAYPENRIDVLPTTRFILPYAAAFLANTTEVVLPEGVINIGKCAFYSASRLQKINIPASVSYIGSNILAECQKVTTFEFATPNDFYTYDEENALLYKTNGNVLILALGLAETVNIKPGTTEIATGVFMSNRTVKTLNIPDSVTKIGYRAFKGCNNLAEINIGSGLVSLDAAAFEALPALETITVDADNTAFCAENNILYDKAKTKLWLCAAKNGLTDLGSVPDTVTQIGDYAFAYHDTISSVVLPVGVTAVGNYAFYECGGIAYIEGSPVLKTIGNYAFGFKMNSDSSWNVNDTLKTVVLHRGITKVGDYAFSGNYGITHLYLDMTYNEARAFVALGAKNMTHLTVGTRNESDGSYYNNIVRAYRSDTLPEQEYAGWKAWHTVGGERVIWDE